MEDKNWIRIIIAGLIGLAMVILVLILLIRAFTGGGTPKSSSQQIDLGKYQDTSATVTLLVDGAPTQIDQDHRQVRITVSQTQNQIEILQGYQDTVMSSRSYPNNDRAFGAFLQSLKLMNFAKGNNDKALADYRGYCPFGNRYVYTFNDGSLDKFQYWSTSCSAAKGTYEGEASSTLNLIRNQIPSQDYEDLTNQLSLGF